MLVRVTALAIVFLSALPFTQPFASVDLVNPDSAMAFGTAPAIKMVPAAAASGTAESQSFSRRVQARAARTFLPAITSPRAPWARARRGPPLKRSLL